MFSRSGTQQSMRTSMRSTSPHCVTRRSTLRRSMRARNSVMPNLNAYEDAYLKIADSMMRGSLLDIPQQKLVEAQPIFEKPWRNEFVKLKTETDMQKSLFINKISTPKPEKLPQKEHMYAKYHMSEWVNNMLLLTYNPVLYFYETRFKQKLGNKPSEHNYRKELKNIEQDLKRLTQTHSSNPNPCLTELLGLPEASQHPEARERALERALTNTRTETNSDKPKIKPKEGKPQVYLQEGQRGLMSAAMLANTLLLRKQPEYVSDIKDVLKHMDEMMQVPICPTPLFQKFLYNYNPRRDMLSKYSNCFAFYKEWTPEIVHAPQVMALKRKQEKELLRYLDIEKNLPTDYRTPNEYRNITIQL